MKVDSTMTFLGTYKPHPTYKSLFCEGVDKIFIFSKDEGIYYYDMEGKYMGWDQERCLENHELIQQAVKERFKGIGY